MKLVEDYRDDIIVLLNKLTPETKQLLVGDANANFTSEHFDRNKLLPIVGTVEYNWDRAYQGAQKDDKQIIADAFIKDQEGTYGYDLEPVRDVIEHIMNDLGLKQSDNPFFKLISELHKDGIDVTRNDLIRLNNLYANGSLSFDQVKGKRSLLYNKDYWLKLDEGQRKEILDRYLHVINHRNSFNPKPTDHGINYKLDNEISTKIQSDPNNAEKYIFVNDGTINGGELREPDKIIRYVDRHYLNKHDADEKSNNNNKDNQNKNTSVLFNQSKLEPTKKGVIDKAVSEGKLKYSDVKEIVKYFEELHKLGKLN